MAKTLSGGSSANKKYSYADPSGKFSDVFGWIGVDSFSNKVEIPAWFPEKGLPIKLSRGDENFGACHIEKKHLGDFHRIIKCNAMKVVWMKLSSLGVIYKHDKEDRLCIAFNSNPRALMVIEYRGEGTPHLSVITLYPFPLGNKVDGKKIGEYKINKDENWRKGRKQGEYATFPQSGFF